jgi:hypothetical protein
MKRTETLMLALFLGVCFAPHCEATVYYSDGSAANLQAIHDNQAQNGDTITLPAGTFTWTTGVTISKGITLQGAGIGQTILRDAMTTGASTLRFNLATGRAARLTGIEMTDGGRTTNPGAAGVLQVQGSNSPGTTFRWDHCRWNQLGGVASLDTVVGVIDHVDFVFGARSNNAMFLWDTRWGGGEYGDGSWSASTGFGTAQMGLFIEDCTVTSTLSGYVTGFTDAYNGARFVVRHCTLTGNTMVQNHGTESSGRGRGTRAMEIYNNTIGGTGLSSVVGGSRSGTVLFHDNTTTGYLIPLVFNLSNYRTHYPFAPWAGADGANVWDVNEPNIFATGTAATSSFGTTVTVSGVNWITNQWVGYSVRRTSNVCNANTITFGLILGNTSNTITYTSNGGYPISSLTFCAGDTLEIRRVHHVFDGIGRAVGSLITGTNPTPPLNWNDQVTEPCYSWNNFQGSAHANFAITDPSIRAGEHFFNDTPMPGYTPYVYPHPLVSGQQPSPTPTPTTSPTATPTATVTPNPTPTATVPPTPTPIPAPNQCEVPDFIGTRMNRAQSVWNNAGFTTRVFTNGRRSQLVIWQSLPQGFIGSCSDTTINIQ